MSNLDVHRAAELGLLPEIRQYIEAGGDLNKRGLYSFTPLHTAVSKGQTEAADLLLDAGAPVDARDYRLNTPLHRAAYCGHVACVELVLQHGADPTALNEAGLMPGREGGFENSVPHEARGNVESAITVWREKRAAMVEAMAEVMEGFDIFDCARRGDLAALRAFVEKGGDVNSKDEDQCNPLHHASTNGHGDFCKVLLDSGADVNARNRFKDTPLHLAALWGHLAIVQLVLDKGAELEATDKHGQTPLHRACHQGKTETARLLLSKGCKVDLPDQQFSTPLHMASEEGRRNVVELLVEAGANPWLKNKRGVLPGESFNGGVGIAERRGVKFWLDEAKTRRPASNAERVRHKSHSIVEYNMAAQALWENEQEGTNEPGELRSPEGTAYTEASDVQAGAPASAGVEEEGEQGGGVQTRLATADAVFDSGGNASQEPDTAADSPGSRSPGVKASADGSRKAGGGCCAVS